MKEEIGNAPDLYMAYTRAVIHRFRNSECDSERGTYECPVSHAIMQTGPS